MPDGTGFAVFREIGPQHMPTVVFVTAYDKYAIQAFEVNAVDYLLKPFDDIRLRESIERARVRLARPAEWMRNLEALLESRGEQWMRRLVVRAGDRFDFVPVESIDWIESANNYSMFGTAVPRTISTGRTWPPSSACSIRAGLSACIAPTW